MFIFTRSPRLNEETIEQPRMRMFKLVPYTADIQQHIWKLEAISRSSQLILSQSGRLLYILIAFLCSFCIQYSLSGLTYKFLVICFIVNLFTLSDNITQCVLSAKCMSSIILYSSSVVYCLCKTNCQGSFLLFLCYFLYVLFREISTNKF